MLRVSIRGRAVTPVIAVLFAAPALVAAQSSAASVPFPQRIDIGSSYQSTAARVGDNLLITGQPTAAALRELKRQGYTTVINLRTPAEMARIGFDEPALVRELGMTYVYLPMRGDKEFPYTPASVTAFARALDQAGGSKVLLHCTVAWRASHLWAAYLVAHKKMSVAEAIRHGQAINLMREHGGAPMADLLGRRIPELREMDH